MARLSGLPDALNAAEAVKAIWQATNKAAACELTTLHAEARQSYDAVQAELAAKRQAHAATQARLLKAGRAELDAAGRQLVELRSQFSTELEHAREQVTSPRNGPRPVSDVACANWTWSRTARQKSDRTAEELRGDLVAARSEARDAAVAQAEARLEAQAAAQRRAERAEAAAALVRQLLAELRVGPPERQGGRRRKPGGPASTERETQGEKQDEEQGPPTAASNPDDGSDSSDDSHDSKN